MSQGVTGRISTVLGVIAFSANVFAATESATKLVPLLKKAKAAKAVALSAAPASAGRAAIGATDADRISSAAEAAPTATNASTTANTTTTKATAAGVAEKKVSVGLSSENWVGSASANVKDASGTMSQNNVSVGYKLAEGRSIQVRQYFLYNMTGSANAQTWGIGDAAVQYTDSTKMLGAAPVEQKVRVYLPVAQTSQDVGRYEVRYTAAITQAAGKYVNIEYAVNPRAYFYTVNSAGQEAFRFIPSISASYAKETAVFVPYTTLSDLHSWGNTGYGLSTSPYSPGVYKRRGVNLDYTLLDLGTKINLSKSVNLDLSFEEGYNLRAADSFNNPDHDFSSYNLNLSVSM